MVILVSTRAQCLFRRAAFHLIGLQPIQVRGVIPLQVQDFVELHEIPVGPFLQPVEVPLDGSTTSWSMNSSSQFCYHLQTC